MKPRPPGTWCLRKIWPSSFFPISTNEKAGRDFLSCPAFFYAPGITRSKGRESRTARTAGTSRPARENRSVRQIPAGLGKSGNRLQSGTHGVKGDRSRFSGYLILKAELYYFCATGGICSGRTRGNGFAAFSAASRERGSRKKSANINI